MLDIIREAPLGQAIRLLSGNRFLKYPEEQDGFEVPSLYLDPLGHTKSEQSGSSHSISGGTESPRLAPITTPILDSELEALGLTKSKTQAASGPYGNERLEAELQLAIERTKSIAIIPQKTADGVILVDWYTSDDPANPQNWTSRKRGFVTFLICFYTWVVYTGASIYAPSEEGVMKEFGVGFTKAVLPLAIYVLAYGIGPLLFAPLTEIPVIGRNPVYFLTFIVFFALSFPTAVVGNFAGLLVLRFLQGFFGSPALANAGATFGDMYSLLYVPYPLSWWVFSAWAGPALGPMMAGFAITAENWRWSLWEIVWMAAPTALFLVIIVPETSTPKILLQRAKRLRKLTGNTKLQSQSEIDQRQLSVSQIAIDALIKPIEITIKDPAVFFVNIYTALFYGIYYTFFEVFPLVFPVSYGFNLGEIGVAFMACLVGASIGVAIYFAYLRYYMIPDNIKNGLREQEHRLVPALLGSLLLPTGLFIFAWTSKSSIHWIVPLIGVVIFVIGTFLILQSIFVYVPLSYPKYAASLFAGNDLVRSSMAAGSIVYARPLFVNLGVAKGVSVLAGLSTLGIFGMVAIYFTGAKLRSRSKFAQS
jgi:DHA1 family multidrug resistance protein-like MFS transporter